MFHFDILTLFPESFDSYFGSSILKRAQAKQLVSIHTHNIRDYSRDKYKTVDDKPYGGGVGMVMKIEPIFDCLKNVFISGTKVSVIDHVLHPEKKKNKRTHRIILLSCQGKRLTQSIVKRLFRYNQLVLICGHYEGIDHRVTKFIDEEVSLGDFVMTGGELAASVIVDTVSRLKPGVLGKDVSSVEESFSCPRYKEYPQYTRPATFFLDSEISLSVPEVLLNGNHGEITKWKEENSRKKLLRD